MLSGRSQMVTTGICGNWHTVVGEIRWIPMPETIGPYDGLSQQACMLVLHPLSNTQPRSADHHAQPRQTSLVLQCACDQTRCSILNPLQPVRDLLRCGSRQSRVTVVDPRCDKRHGLMPSQTQCWNRICYAVFNWITICFGDA